MATTVKVLDRLQPALLDRLCDDQPDVTTEPPEQRVMSRQALRDAVLRDLSWLFNCTRLSDSEPLDDYPQVRRSVLNFGLPTFSGQTASSLDPGALEVQVRDAILDHEPRILRETLKVEILIHEMQLDQHNQITFRITGQLWAQPVPLELLLHTDVDLETGRINVRELAH